MTVRDDSAVVHGTDEQARRDAAGLLASGLAQQALLQQGERIRAMVESAHDAVVTIDETGVIESWNGRAQIIFGWRAEEALGQSLSSLIIPAAFRQAHEEGMARFLKTGGGRVLNRTMEVMALTKAGREVPVELSIWPFQSGARCMFGSFIRDVSARHRAEAQLRRQAEQAIRFRDSLLELSRLPKTDFNVALNEILRMDARTLQVSRVSFWRFQPAQQCIACERLFQADSKEIVDASGTVLHERDYPDYFAAMASARPVVADDALNHPDTRAFAAEYLVPNGVVSMLDTGVWFQGHIAGVLCHEQVGGPRAWSLEEVDYATAVASKISLALESSLRAQAEQETLRALTREKALSEVRARFVSIASHEFRTPLSAIKSSVELLKDYGERLDPAERTEVFETIERYVKRMTEMLDQVLQLGRADAGRIEFTPRPLDLEAFLWQVIEEVVPRTAPRHRVELRAEGDLRALPLDERLLRNIATNLLSNAVKYSPEGGVVAVFAGRDAGALTLRIADRGIGIPAADQARLFESFYRARNVGGISGSGLGLAIVKRAVDLHGGSISVASESGQGTVFTIRLPLGEAGANPMA